MRENKRLYFDTETYKDYYLDEVVNKVYLLDAYDGNTHKHYFDVYAFIDDLFQYKTVELIAYNTLFDFTAILIELGAYIDTHNLLISEKGDFIKAIVKIKKGKLKTKIIFKDLWIFDKSKSLRDWYDFLHPNDEVGKGLIQYDKWNLTNDGVRFHFDDVQGNKHTALISDEVDYIKHDTEILPEIDEYIKNYKREIQKFVTKEFKLVRPPKCVNKLTIPGVAKEVANAILQDRYKLNFDELFRPNLTNKWKNPFLYDDYVQNSKLGGFTSFNKELTHFNETAHYFDFNSMYPYIMTLPLPIFEPFKTVDEVHKNCKKLNFKDYSIKKMYLITYKYTEWCDDFKFIGKLPIKSRIKHNTFFIFEEFFEALKGVLHFEELQIIETYYIAAAPVLKEFNEHLYKLKSEAPNPTIKGFAKLLLNSTYGKTNESAQLTQYSLDENYWLYLTKSRNFESLGTFAGIYICSKGQTMIIDLIKKCKANGLDWFYIDTDSITVLGDYKKLNLEIDDKKLGALKLEGIFDEGHNPELSKKYYLKGDKGDKLATSGIAREYVECLPERFKLMFYSSNYNLCFKGVKTASIKNFVGQPIIKNVDFESNNKKEIDYYLHFNKELHNNKIIITLKGVEDYEKNKVIF